MDHLTELVFRDGLPQERLLTEEELANREMLHASETISAKEPPSDPLTSEPSSGNVFAPSETGNLAKGRNNAELDYRRAAVAYWKSGVRKQLSFATVQSKFVKVKSRGMLQHWAKQLNPASRMEKLRLLEAKTLELYDAVSRPLIA